jgi:hypothetical protein
VCKKPDCEYCPNRDICEEKGREYVLLIERRPAVRTWDAVERIRDRRERKAFRATTGTRIG